MVTRRPAATTAARWSPRPTGVSVGLVQAPPTPANVDLPGTNDCGSRRMPSRLSSRCGRPRHATVDIGILAPASTHSSRPAHGASEASRCGGAAKSRRCDPMIRRVQRDCVARPRSCPGAAAWMGTLRSQSRGCQDRMLGSAPVDSGSYPSSSGLRRRSRMVVLVRVRVRFGSMDRSLSVLGRGVHRVEPKV